MDQMACSVRCEWQLEYGLPLGVSRSRGVLSQMAKVARSYGVDFDKDHPVHGGRHDKFFIGGRPVEVPRHNEIVEFTARGI